MPAHALSVRHVAISLPSHPPAAPGAALSPSYALAWLSPTAARRCAPVLPSRTLAGAVSWPMAVHSPRLSSPYHHAPRQCCFPFRASVLPPCASRRPRGPSCRH
ncbi:hypothetical protein DENSPDRAFT_885844 [Dentipellis sp. KUC8613]|nr:hypothetical protein DENSPDRAFT_885844 [Dentipellis sp. KUC8613]